MQQLAYTRFYEESNKTNVVGNIVSWAVIFLITLMVGYFYSIAISLIPIIYFNVIITVAFGLLLWVVIRILVRFTHNRNKRNQMILIIGAAIFANYFQWASYILYMSSDAVPSFSEYLVGIGWIFSPGNFFEPVSIIKEVGPWSVFGVPFKGVMLVGVWIIEAGIISVMPIILVSRSQPYPYSEIFSKWYPKITLDTDFESLGGATLIPKLAENPLAALQALGKGSAYRSTKIHIYYLREEEKQYLTAEVVAIESQTGVKSGNKVVNNFQINRHEAELILENFRHKRTRYDLL